MLDFVAIIRHSLDVTCATTAKKWRKRVDTRQWWWHRRRRRKTIMKNDVHIKWWAHPFQRKSISCLWLCLVARADASHLVRSQHISNPHTANENQRRRLCWVVWLKQKRIEKEIVRRNKARFGWWVRCVCALSSNHCQENFYYFVNALCESWFILAQNSWRLSYSYMSRAARERQPRTLRTKKFLHSSVASCIRTHLIIDVIYLISFCGRSEASHTHFAVECIHTVVVAGALQCAASSFRTCDDRAILGELFSFVGCNQICPFRLRETSICAARSRSRMPFAINIQVVFSSKLNSRRKCAAKTQFTIII